LLLYDFKGFPLIYIDLIDLANLNFPVIRNINPWTAEKECGVFTTAVQVPFETGGA